MSTHATAADLPSEFDATDAGVVELWLETAAAQVGLKAWGKLAKRAHILLTSHYLKQSGEGANAKTGTGQLASRTVGPFSEAYVVNPGATDLEGLTATSYGRAYLQLRRMRSPRFHVLGGPRA